MLFIFSSIFFTFMFHPFYMSLILMISVIFLIFSMNLFHSHWFSYILTLVYLGGILILFIYISSIMPKILYTKVSLIIFNLILIINLLFVNFVYSMSTLVMKTSYLSNLLLFSSLKSFFFLLILLGFLLFVLIISIKLVKFDLGPMRQL